MDRYRAFLVDERGQYVRVVELECEDDARALERARLFTGQGALEVWRSAHYVGRVEATPPRPH